MARTTVANTIERIRRQLGSSFRSEVNTLATTVTSSTTSIVLTYALPNGLIAGSIVCIGVESMRVMAVSTSTLTLTVLRGYGDTDGAAHTAGDEVLINPRFEPGEIFDAMIEELNSWGPELYRVVSDTVAISGESDALELPVAFLDAWGIIDARVVWTDSESIAWPRLNVRVVRGDPAEFTGVSTSGILLRFIDAVGVGSAYVTAKMPFVVTGLTSASDLVTDVGLEESMLDVLGYGVKLRLILDSETNRTSRSAQDAPRNAEDVPVAGYIPHAQFTARLYQTRMQQEINKLRARYPVAIR